MKLANLLALTAAPFALFAANPALADNHATTETAAAPAMAKGPAMWKVADEDTTIYLFGTVHILPQGIDWYDTTIATALEGSDMIVTEIPMDPASEAAMGQLAQTKGVLPTGTTLRSLLSPEQKATYEAAVTKLARALRRCCCPRLATSRKARWKPPSSSSAFLTGWIRPRRSPS